MTKATKADGTIADLLVDISKLEDEKKSILSSLEKAVEVGNQWRNSYEKQSHQLNDAAKEIKNLNEALVAKDNQIKGIKRDLLTLSRLLKIIKATVNSVRLTGEDQTVYELESQSPSFTMKQVG